MPMVPHSLRTTVRGEALCNRQGSYHFSAGLQWNTGAWQMQAIRESTFKWFLLQMILSSSTRGDEIQAWSQSSMFSPSGQRWKIKYVCPSGNVPALSQHKYTFKARNSEGVTSTCSVSCVTQNDDRLSCYQVLVFPRVLENLCEQDKHL